MAHIPTVDIRQLGDISFDRQLALAQQPNRDYNVDQWLFVPNTYTEYRYILGTRGEKPLICVGINPSHSDNHYLHRSSIADRFDKRRLPPIRKRKHPVRFSSCRIDNR